MGGTAQKATLVEKSATARKLGGAEFIRNLPLIDRLIVSAEVGFDLGREKAAKGRATKALGILEKKLEPEQLAQFALKYELKESFPRIILIARETDLHMDFLLRGVEAEKSQGRRKGAIASMLRGQISEGNFCIARILAAEFGVPKGELVKIGRRVHRAKIRTKDYDAAESLASTLKLRQERHRSRLTSVISCIRAGKFEEAERKSDKWGLGHKILRQAALEVFDGLMKNGEFLPAAATARHFKLFKEMRSAVLSEYNRLKSQKEYRAAARLAKEYRMVAQMQSAGGMAVNMEEKRSLKVAASLAKEFGLIKKEQRIARKRIAISIARGNFFEGSEIAAEHGLEELRVTLFMSGVEKEFEEGRPVVAFEKARFAGLGERVTAFAWKFFYNALSNGDYPRAWEFAQNVGLVEAQKMLKELESIVGPRI